MLPERIIKSVELVCKVGFTIGAFPYHFDSTSSTIVLTKSRRKIIIWKLSFVYICVNTVFMIFRLGQATCCMKNMSYGKLLLNLFSVITWTTGLVVEINTFLYKEQIPEFMNHLFKTEKYFFCKLIITLDTHLCSELHI